MNNSEKTNDSGAAIICPHVAKLGYPILRADRDEPTMPVDTGWQFLCNSADVEEESEAEVWALSEVLEFEPSLGEFADYPPGTTIIRDSQNSPWRQQQDSGVAF